MNCAYAVTIAGQKYILRSEEERDYIENLAGYVSYKIDEIQQATNAVATHSVAVLAAVNIADELFRERRAQEERRQELAESAKGLIRHLDNSLMEQDRPSRQAVHICTTEESQLQLLK